MLPMRNGFGVHVVWKGQLVLEKGRGKDGAGRKHPLKNWVSPFDEGRGGK